jgi:hypothetical protein
MAGALVALLCDFAQQAAVTARALRTAAAGVGDNARRVRTLQPWLALRLAAELGGAALAAATRSGCAGATLLVFGHMLANASTDTRLFRDGDAYTLDAGQRRRQLAAGAALTALGVVACATGAAGPLPAPALALATSGAFSAATGGWVLYRAGWRVLEVLLEAAFGCQRC